MISLGRSFRVWAYPEPADLRKGFNGLYGLVEIGLGRDPLSGDLFLFVNCCRTRCKVLMWSGTGSCVLQKRLERGRCAPLWRSNRKSVQLTPSELSLFLEGCTLESTVVLEKLGAWLWSQATLESLSIGKAARYTLGNWEQLTRFVDDPHIPLDDNRTERGIRGTVVGLSNHVGSKSRRGSEVAAIFYTLSETARLVGVAPAAYLSAGVRAADLGEILLPVDFAAAA